MIDKDNIVTYKLMIKQHNITGLKYLCITKKDDYVKYTGSGSLWKKHIQKYGYDVTTVVIAETSDVNELSKLGKYYSELFDVVNSSEYANLIPEIGYAYKSDTPFSNFSINEKEQLYQHIALVNKKIWANKTEEEKTNYSIALKERWTNYSPEFIEEYTDKLKSLWSYNSLSIDHKGYGYGNERREQYSNIVKNIWSNMSESERKQRSKNISIGRLSMSDEDKQKRAEKIKQFWDNNQPLKEEMKQRLSKERCGINNPYAKLVEYCNVTYTKSEFTKKFGKVEKYIDDPQFKILYTDTHKVYEVLKCPYCGKESSPDKKPSSFKRWHFENCKEKNK